MSVINQVLLNLEKRRASPAERGLLPEHVQVPPEGARAPYWKWIAAGAAFAVAAPAGWVALTATVAGTTRLSAERSSADRVIEKVVSTSAGTSEDTYLQELRSFRLSLELSAPPAEPAPLGSAQDRTPPISSARVIGRLAGEAVADAAPAGAAAPARGEAGRNAAVAPARPAEEEAAGMPQIRKEMRDPTPRELSDDAYRKAVVSLNQGRRAEAEAGFHEALSLAPEHHAARQGLVGLLVQGRRLEEAERVLEEGVKHAPAPIGFNTTLARIQADRGDNASAIATLQKGLEIAQGSAEYVAFLAALLQRQGRHEEAIAQFQAALRIRPATGVWWLGLAMSLQSANQPAAAQSAYQRARASGNLHPELAALAEQRLQQLQ
jgi:MSHA biogenesis protein MshN